MFKGQSEDDIEILNENTKSMLMQFMGQLKIGMDLTKIPIPCDFLEPRSLLEKLTDFNTHAHLLTTAMDDDDPIQRMVHLVRWYLSGWHVKPKGVKKPYNPVLGEVFRCNYELRENGLMTCIGEQVSHHPPKSAIYAECKQKELLLEGWYYPRSKFLGNSAASITEGNIKITFGSRGNEVYTATWPSVYARGVIFGKLIMEMAGKTKIECKKTNMLAEIEFKSKPFFGGEYNVVSAKIKHKKKTIYQIRGKWNEKLYIKGKDSDKNSEELFFDVRSAEVVPKHVPPMEVQKDNESRKLWDNLTKAIKQNDVQLAAIEKDKVETEQRNVKKEREQQGQVFTPKLFKAGPEDFWTFVGFE
ncbi:predicted protein [Naegleria gruberi]|uniref:Predicted protein n=1 Tax=Naegleria gruberi TaxID=5762 RepID=D2VAQ6_NAEGR|nr:uncharacterized protein NAEGRDRAFT_32649 [Naegleria gruberi]EFC46120.1 predicted protein [Naegleria gruberi]|eukprot:XP_002678864.1 predicted protein [Naegleria gruberi strain NEG-M]